MQGFHRNWVEEPGNVNFSHWIFVIAVSGMLALGKVGCWAPVRVVG